MLIIWVSDGVIYELFKVIGRIEKHLILAQSQIAIYYKSKMAYDAKFLVVQP